MFACSIGDKQNAGVCWARCGCYDSRRVFDIAGGDANYEKGGDGVGGQAAAAEGGGGEQGEGLGVA